MKLEEVEMKTKMRILKLVFFVFLSVFMGLAVPKLCNVSAAETVTAQEVSEDMETTETTAVQNEDEVNFFLFFALGIVLLLAVVAAVVVVIVSGTTAAVIVPEEE